MKSSRRTLKISLITIIAFLVMTLCFVLFVPVYNSKLIYSSKTIVQSKVEYDYSSIANVCRVSVIELSLDTKSMDILIPDKLDGGTIVEGLGCVTKGEEYLSFSLKGKELIGISGGNIEEQLEKDKTTYFSVKIKLGKNIALADCALDREKYIYQIDNSNEYICVNVTYEVSPDNRWYYSENGKLYEKDDAGFFESTRTYRVWEARMED